jgi:HAD superfamily hydrolase (TIGR01490 family)
MAVALFDLDGTLTEDASCERRFVLHLAARGLLGGRQMATAAGFALRHWPVYGRHVLKKDKAYLAGLSVAEITSVADAFARKDLEPRLRPGVVARLERHRRRGDPAALITGAPDFIVAPLADRLGFDAWRATRFAVQDGRFLAAPPRDHPFAEEKLRHANEICARFAERLADCTAYGDSIYDLPLLTQVGHPVAVAPDAGLAKAARAAGWEILTPTRAKDARTRHFTFARQ